MIFQFQILDLLKTLVSQSGMIAFFSFIFSRVKIFRTIFYKSKTSLKEKAVLILFFSGIGILGTYTGIPVKGALANTRVVGVFVGGLLGGPIVGICSGVIAGFHRWAIDIGGFTAFSCMISTIIEGVLASILYKMFQESKNKWLFASLFGILAEVLQMVIILLTAKPLYQALELVNIIGLPMIFGNGVAIGMFIAIADSFFREREKIAAINSQKVLTIAQESLPFLTLGLNSETAEKTAKIIYKQLNLAAVSFTTTDKCLAHVGLGDDHHYCGISLKTSSSLKAIQTGKSYIANQKNSIDCSSKECPLKSAVIAPLVSGERIIGALKLYRDKEFAITRADEEVAKGLATLFSLQIEKSRIQEQACLLSRAELKALQSQINPHFLFNTINTVTSFIRTNPEKARELLLDLSDYYRFRLQEPDDFIPLKRELDHVKAYLEIEKARFNERLEILFIGPQNLENMVPPLIIQPLVENSVKHGIKNSTQGGRIIISVVVVKNSVKISILDNGSGIEESRLKTILQEPSKCVGLINVHKRLINAYGLNNGLKIKSKTGEGTEVCLTIPSEF